ncbi:tyrosine protein phosphatase [Bacillus timonensis]|nr:tyrosine protein phosphatase [Bacillus timonensis]
MIDIHCHILPGVDDGAKDLNESVEMARLAVKEGITTIIATPHHMNGKFENERNFIFDRVLQLNETLSQQNIPLQILAGQETRIYGEILQDYEEAKILSLNNSGKYLFIELPSGHVPRYTEKLLFDLQLSGLTPIIVHPERNQEIIENPDILYKLVKNGAATQITASSLTGHFGKKIKKFSFQLIESSLTHFIASDAHDIKGRSFKMDEAFTLLKKEFGVEAEFYYKENASLLVDGKAIMKSTPEKVKKRKLLGLFSI